VLRLNDAIIIIYDLDIHHLSYIIMTCDTLVIEYMVNSPSCVQVIGIRC